MIWLGLTKTRGCGGKTGRIGSLACQRVCESVLRGQAEDERGGRDKERALTRRKALFTHESSAGTKYATQSFTFNVDGWCPSCSEVERRGSGGFSGGW